MLLTALNQNSIDSAAECIIHVWYSAALTQDHMDILSGPVRKLIQEVCGKIAGKKTNAVLGKTWQFESGSLRLVLSKTQWSQLLRYFEVPQTLTGECANSIRRAVTLAPERRDYRDRALFAKSAEHRLGSVRFREDGILLPFGHSRGSFNIPNPTMFQSDNWPMMDSSEPMQGWDYAEVLEKAHSAASNDVYGKLYAHIRDLIAIFCTRSKTLGIHYTLLNVDAKDLHQHQVEDGKFARVEVMPLP